MTFEGDDCVFGLNFTSQDECAAFHQCLLKKRDQEERSVQKKKNPAPKPPNAVIHEATVTSPAVEIGSPVVGKANKLQWKKDKKPPAGTKKRLDKGAIGQPTNFEHKVHVGWNATQGIDVSGTGHDFDPSVEEMLRKLGYSPKNMTKKDKHFVYDIIQREGGMEKLEAELREAAPPPPPPKRPVSGQKPQAPPPPPLHPHVAKESAVTGGGDRSNLAAPGGDRANLLAEIQRGAQLKEVDPGEIRDRSTNDTQAALNQAIQKGAKLKHVSAEEVNANRQSDPLANMG